MGLWWNTPLVRIGRSLLPVQAYLIDQRLESFVFVRGTNPTTRRAREGKSPPSGNLAAFRFRHTPHVEWTERNHKLLVVDGLLAATAHHHDLILVTRNVDDVAPTGVQLFNPWG